MNSDPQGPKRIARGSQSRNFQPELIHWQAMAATLRRCIYNIFLSFEQFNFIISVLKKRYKEKLGKIDGERVQIDSDQMWYFYRFQILYFEEQGKHPKNETRFHKTLARDMSRTQLTLSLVAW